MRATQSNRRADGDEIVVHRPVRNDAGLRVAVQEAALDLYVHAPYRLNVATANNRVRIPSRQLLAKHAATAADTGAKGLIVHGGHVLAADDLDTCHAHAGGEELAGLVDRVKAVTGRVDLVHANDSRDTFGSGADRHTNFGSGEIDGDDLLAVIAAAGAPVVCETPGGAAGQGADIAWLRERLPA